MVSVHINAENVGSRKITVASTRYRVFRAPRPRLAPDRKFAILDLPIEKDRQELASGELTPVQALAHVYPPKAKSSQTLDFIMRPDSEYDIFFVVQLLDDHGDQLGFEFGVIDKCEPPATK
jgi:hypothetical protein